MNTLDDRYTWDDNQSLQIFPGDGPELNFETDSASASDADGLGPELQVNGLDVVIETPKGYTRHGKDYEVTMPAHYGYIKGIKGADGDSLDCYVGPNAGATWAYVIDQRTLDGKRFDEHKVMLGFDSARVALEAYRAGHHRADDVFMDWTPMEISDFKQWLTYHDMRKPCAES